MNDLPERFAEFIEGEGHTVVIDRFGEDDRGADLKFRSSGKKYRVRVDRTDNAYFALTIGYRLTREATREVMFDAAKETCAAIKAVKIDFEADTFEASVEQFFDGKDGYQPIFWRCVNAATQAANDFMSRVDAAQPPDAVEDARVAADRFVAEFMRGKDSK